MYFYYTPQTVLGLKGGTFKSRQLFLYSSEHLLCIPSVINSSTSVKFYIIFLKLGKLQICYINHKKGTSHRASARFHYRKIYHSKINTHTFATHSCNIVLFIHDIFSHQSTRRFSNKIYKLVKPQMVKIGDTFSSLTWSAEIYVGVDSIHFVHSSSSGHS